MAQAQTKTQTRDDVFGVLLAVNTKDVKNDTTQFGYLVRPFGKDQKAAWYNAASRSENGKKYLGSFKPGSRVGITLVKDSDFPSDIDKIHPVYAKKANK